MWKHNSAQEESRRTHHAALAAIDNGNQGASAPAGAAAARADPPTGPAGNYGPSSPSPPHQQPGWGFHQPGSGFGNHLPGPQLWGVAPPNRPPWLPADP